MFAHIATIPEDCPSDTEYAGFYLSRAQHLIESPLLAIVGLFMAMRLGSPAGISAVVRQTKWTWRRTPLELLMLAIAIASFSLIIYHKICKEKVGFLLQPCHVCHVLMIIILALPAGPGLGALLFNYYCHWLFSPFLGLVGAELDCYKQRFELFNWFAQHLLLLVAPIVLVLSRRHPLSGQPRFFFHAFFVAVVYHFFLLEIASRVTGLNINYMFCPVPVLRPAGRTYRFFMTCAVILISAFARYGVLGGACWLLGRPAVDETRFWTHPEVFEFVPGRPPVKERTKPAPTALARSPSAAAPVPVLAPAPAAAAVGTTDGDGSSDDEVVAVGLTSLQQRRAARKARKA